MLPFKGKDPEERRFALLSIVMLGVLLLSVAVAWSLVAGASSWQDTGEEVMQRVRRDGLELLWRDRPSLQWYLTRVRVGDRVENVGWRVRSLVERDEGGFRGVDVIHPAPGRSGPGHVEVWTLNTNATGGTYQASDLKIRRGLPNSLSFSAQIELRDGSVRLVQRGGVISTAETPPNYVPEGTLHLACYLAARRGEKAQFKMIFNRQPPRDRPRGRQTRFSAITVQSVEELEDGWRVECVASSVGFLRVMHFDRKGRLVREIGRELEHVAVSQEDALETFPQAASDLRAVLARVLPRTDNQTSEPPEDNGTSARLGRQGRRFVQYARGTDVTPGRTVLRMPNHLNRRTRR